MGLDPLLAEPATRPEGLTSEEAERRRRPAPRRHGRSVGRLLAAQFFDPMVLLLLGAAAISFFTGSTTDGGILLGIVGISGSLGFAQELAAEGAVARLLDAIRVTATVRRDGRSRAVPVEEVVEGDVVLLSAGASAPGDGTLLESAGLQVDESALTGESFPVEKRAGDEIRFGTHVVSGTGAAVVARIGSDTELGRIREHLRRRRTATEFELGLQRFGGLLVRVSALMMFALFAVNVFLHRPVLDSFLFATALAVGLVPELLPAIVTVNLSHGARRMAREKVVVKRLTAIQDLGSVEVLCSDKTGTLTVGRVRLAEAVGVDGRPSARVQALGWLNAALESGYANPIDQALRDAGGGDATGCVRVGEVPYDFVRRRLTVIVERGGAREAVTKGQLGSVLAVCGRAELPDGRVVPLDEVRAEVEATHDRLARAGLRALGVARAEVGGDGPWGVELEQDLVLVGILAFADPLRPDAAAVLEDLRSLGVELVLLTGDDRRVATEVWRTLHGAAPALLTGPELRELGAEALERRCADVRVFAEVQPMDKERIVRAFRRTGRVVGVLGDGINDAPALRAADVGLTVDGAADVAREAADIVLGSPDLAVIAAGVREGRRTVANTLKYVHYTTSANFGNMLSMAVAAAFLPFLPLLPKQILLNNFLSDLPAMAIAEDRVDPERLAVPARWRNEDIRRFMFVFGTISSVFDALAFATLLALTRGDAETFRTGWFVESLWTELFVLLVLRSPLPLGRSRPAGAVLGLVFGVAALTLVLPWSPLASTFGLVPLSGAVVGALVAVTTAYLATTEAAKRLLHARAGRAGDGVGAPRYGGTPPSQVHP